MGRMMEKGKGSKSLQALRKKRNQIDLIDQKLLNLLNKRLSIALEIGKIKKERREKIYNPRREDEVLKRLTFTNQGPLKEEDLKKIFKKIMGVCRKSQNT
jgi:chorismate mutase/prephenate dehydratase